MLGGENSSLKGNLNPSHDWQAQGDPSSESRVIDGGGDLEVTSSDWRTLFFLFNGAIEPLPPQFEVAEPTILGLWADLYEDVHMSV